MQDLVCDISHNGKDITMYKKEDDTLIVDIKHPCGELIKGWDGLTDFQEALSLAKTYIHALNRPTISYCSSEYCKQEAKNNQIYNQALNHAIIAINRKVIELPGNTEKYNYGINVLLDAKESIKRLKRY